MEGGREGQTGGLAFVDCVDCFRAFQKVKISVWSKIGPKMLLLRYSLWILGRYKRKWQIEKLAVVRGSIRSW